MAATTAAVTAYKKGSFTQDLDFTDDSNYADESSRLLRYAVFEQYLNGNPYDKDVAKWANKYKADHGLYEYTRPIANPILELVEFYETHIWGGWLDPEAGDSVESALPIVTEVEALREHIAQLWQWSNWIIERDNVARDGAGLGDAFIQVIDDVDHKKVHIKIVHPSKVRELVKDQYGNIKAYKISYMRTDDKEGSTNEVEYTETAERDGDNVVYKLFKNGSPHPWDNAEFAEWSEPYGFIPMVHIMHRSTPYGWGAAEVYSRLALVREVDDQRSLLSDQIRKVINPVQVIKGETANGFEASQFSDPTSANPQIMREQIPMIFLANSDSSIDPMVSDLDIDAVLRSLEALNKKFENSYPEISLTRIMDMAQASGVTVRRLQAPAERKVQKRRDVYDAGLIKVMQMALSIGGYRGLFKGITLDSYANGGLDFSIGKRPVFATDPMDDMDIKKAQSEVLANMSNVGNLDEAVKYVYGEDSELVGTLNQVDILEPARDGADAAETPETLASEKGLNGAQIKAAVDLLAGVTAGTVAELNAIELLTSLGIASDRAKAMAAAAKGQKVDTNIVKEQDDDKA